MKRINLLLILILFAKFSFAQVITNGLVGYWPLDGNVNDESGNNNNGTVNGATLTTDRFGNDAGAYQFDGYDDYIEVQGNYTLGNNATTCAWFKLENGTYTQNQHILNFDTERAGRIAIFISAGGGYSLLGAFRDELDNGIGSVSGTTQNLNDGQWHFASVTYDGEDLKVYLDGAWETTLNIRDKIIHPINGIGYFGKHPTSGSHFKGSLDDIRIYNKSLSDTEIALLFNECSTCSSTTNCVWSQTETGTNIYYNNGNVGIGTDKPGIYKLAVEGVIGAREVNVTTDVWADFVFQDDYQLMNLSDLETYINKNKHLPDIPSEAEVEENGISVGEMNAKLLQKIEELTLYIIELEKRVKSIETKN